MNAMFKDCSSLKELNISNFNINKMEKSVFMFSGCSNDLKTKIKMNMKITSDKIFKDLKKFKKEL